MHARISVWRSSIAEADEDGWERGRNSFLREYRLQLTVVYPDGVSDTTTQFIMTGPVSASSVLVAGALCSYIYVEAANTHPNREDITSAEFLRKNWARLSWARRCRSDSSSRCSLGSVYTNTHTHTQVWPRREINSCILYTYVYLPKRVHFSISYPPAFSRRLPDIFFSTWIRRASPRGTYWCYFRWLHRWLAQRGCIG